MSPEVKRHKRKSSAKAGRNTAWSCKSYNYKLKADVLNILKSEDKLENRGTGEALILKEEVEKAAQMLKNDQSPGVDNIPVEVLNHGGPGVALIVVGLYVRK